MALKKIKNTASYSRTCHSCGKTFTFAGVGFDATSAMIDHYKAKHSDRMAKCFDDYGRTWNAQYDACLKALHNTAAQRDQMMKERDAAAAQQRTLATKLNAVVLVLRND